MKFFRFLRIFGNLSKKKFIKIGANLNFPSKNFKSQKLEMKILLNEIFKKSVNCFRIHSRTLRTFWDQKLNLVTFQEWGVCMSLSRKCPTALSYHQELSIYPSVVHRLVSGRQLIENAFLLFLNTGSQFL